MNTVFYGLLLAAALLSTLFFYTKYKMKISKGKFALRTMSLLVTCLLLGITSLSSSVAVAALSTATNYIGLGEISTAPKYMVLVLLLVTMISILYIFTKTIKNWEAPKYISDVTLQERGEKYENSLISLTIEQIKFLLSSQKDEKANDSYANWREQEIETPQALETKDILKELIEGRVSELKIDEYGWRDLQKLWVGKIFSAVDNSEKNALVIIFDEEVSQEVLSARLENIVKDSDISNSKIFAIYKCPLNQPARKNTYTIHDLDITVYSSYDLITGSLDLSGYAKQLIKNYDKSIVGGTTTLLKDSFVELYVTSTDNHETTKPLKNVISQWEKSDTQCQLAITGEYGLGKSTALMEYCVTWARNFLSSKISSGRIPLLIELRGKSPSELDPLSFLSTWAVRYGLKPHAIHNLIKTGAAIVIFEGFDEINNAGTEYYRHQHFNALWQFAYPDTKIIFTGRPYFFSATNEKYRALRSHSERAIAGGASTTIWELKKLSVKQIEVACRNFNKDTRIGIINAVREHKDFLEIVSRPSMLPVVATIWPTISSTNNNNIGLTKSELIEFYIKAVFSRKEEELEIDKVKKNAPIDSRYLHLPREVREILTMCVAWRMSGQNLKNTIPREEVSKMVNSIFDILFLLGKSDNTDKKVSLGLVNFEKKYHSKSKSERIEIITSEICSAGLLVDDPAGGTTNLRFPHKQFYEYLIAKVANIVANKSDYYGTLLLRVSSSNFSASARLMSEPNSINYLTEFSDRRFSKFTTVLERLSASLQLISLIKDRTIRAFLSRFSKANSSAETTENEDLLDLLINEGNYISESINSISQVTKIISLALFALIYATLNSLVNTDSKFYQVTLILTLAVSMAIVMMIVTINKRRGFSLVYMQAYGVNHSDVPKNNTQYLVSTLNSVIKGKVVLKHKSSLDSVDHRKFCYPLECFGNKSK